MYINPTSFIQFELWKDCTLGCAFCCNKGQPATNKLDNLRRISKLLSMSEISKFDEIGFIGGEFFDGQLADPKVLHEFYNILKQASDYSPKTIYITSALLFNINPYLIPCLEYLKNLNCLDKVVICTSYDTAYRFTPHHPEELWKENVLYIQKNYPSIRVHTEIILTQAFIDSVLIDNFCISSFQTEFNTSIDYIEPSSGLFYKNKAECARILPRFFPTRSSFIQFIKKIKDEINFSTFLSMELRSNTLYFLEDNELRLATDRRNSDGKCNLKNKDIAYEIGFIDSEATMRETALEIGNLLGIYTEQ